MNPNQYAFQKQQIEKAFALFKSLILTTEQKEELEQMMDDFKKNVLLSSSVVTKPRRMKRGWND
jgi:hypothetical protein